MLVGTANFFGCGKGGHKVRDLPNIKFQEKDCQATCSMYAHLKKYFYALHTRGEHETSSDVVTSMFKIIKNNMYALLYLEATFSFLHLL